MVKVNRLLKIGWVELVVALLMGAPVRLKSGRVIQLRTPKHPDRSALDPSIFGFDFSKWQGIIDFFKVLVYGAKFIILRCAYGITRDERFVEYIVECLKYFPTVTSAYHYYDPVYHPIAQADEVIEILLPYKDKIRRVYGDFEFYWSGSYESSANWKIYAERIIEAGFEFGVYTRKTWWDSRVGSLASWFGQFPLWAAQYATSLTMIPLGWTKADIWQQGTPAIGLEVGTQSLEVDIDIMDDEFFVSEYDGEPLPPPPGGEMYYELKPVGDYNVSIRGDHPEAHILGGWLGRIENSSRGKALEKYEYPADKYVSGLLRAKQGDIWWRVYEAGSVAIDGWSAQKHLGVTYLNVTQVGTPPSTTLPASVESTDVWKDENGNVIATYKGVLTRQA